VTSASRAVSRSRNGPVAGAVVSVCRVPSPSDGEGADVPVQQPGDPVPIGGQFLDAVGDGDRVVPGVGADRGRCGAAFGLLRLFGGGDGGVHRGVDPVGVLAHPRFGVVPDEDRLAEGDPVAELPGALLRGVGCGHVPVGFVGEGVGPGLLPGGAVSLHGFGGPVPVVDGDDHVVPRRRGVSRRCR